MPYLPFAKLWILLRPGSIATGLSAQGDYLVTLNNGSSHTVSVFESRGVEQWTKDGGKAGTWEYDGNGDLGVAKAPCERTRTAGTNP